MRLLASLMNMSMLNDEGRISVYLGLGVYTIPLMVSGVLFYIVYKTTRAHNLKWKFHLLTTSIIIVAVTALVFIDQYFKIILL
ncbi:MAG: MFS superfamily sulfate permease-like transporter [Nonlabens sp.]|jgi:MFS superfamily sulfate permease-like transporter